MPKLFKKKKLTEHVSFKTEHVSFKIIVIFFNFDALKQEFILNAFQKPPGHLKRIRRE